jgi:hypothetical protein
MPRLPLFTIFCMTTGFVIGTLGALIVLAQGLEWWSFGDWNPVSIGYVLDHFRIQPPNFYPTASGKLTNWLRDKCLDFPLSIALLGIGGVIAAIGIRHARKRATTAHDE